MRRLAFLTTMLAHIACGGDPATASRDVAATVDAMFEVREDASDVQDAGSDLAVDLAPHDLLDVPAPDPWETADGGVDLPPDLPEVPDDAEVAEVQPDAADDAATPPAPLAIRFMAANLTSGNLQSYDPGHGIRLMAACRPDVILIQEFNYRDDTTADYRAMTDAVCGTTCTWHTGAGQIPNGVVSRWPIVETGAWDDPNIDNRDLDWVRVDLPGARDLVAISVHLHTSPAGDQLAAAQVVAHMVSEYRAAHPDCCYYVVGGDFNGPAAVSDAGFGAWNGEAVFHVTGPHPVGNDGSPGTNAGRDDQYDFVLFDPALEALRTPLVATAADGSAQLAYPDGLVFDSRDYTQAELDSFFPPALVDDSGASNMQHMGVLRSVAIP